ncbi:hypothetical protein DSO57_1026710 [Entomophthora muscae]|uniref:Uncharacterized protein n=1 Tax=Entomophthora muscae TaxID=34485 RepID=A0ACC2SQX9_9FUNG|nr:hypothetical protein DSO57_1026710 [Entomophthora muscae]
MQKEKLIVLITGIGAVSLMLIGMGISLWKTKGQPTQASSQAETAAIVGGSKTDLAYNWIASLSYNGIHRCGAVLVGTNTVITAAHCKDGDLDKWALQVPKSKTNLTSASTFKIKQWKNHPKYRHENYSYDVAILKIHGNFPPADKVIFATKLTAKNATVAGWGSVKEQAPGFASNDTTTELHTATVPIVDKSRCEAIEKKKITDTLFCAGDWDAMIDSCTGDSGGPIFLPSHPPTLLGLVGGGEGCGSWETHGKYTYAKYIPELLGAEDLAIQNTTLPPKTSSSITKTIPETKLPAKTSPKTKTRAPKTNPKSTTTTMPAPVTKTRAKKRTKTRAPKSKPKPSTRTVPAPVTKTRAKKRTNTGIPKSKPKPSTRTMSSPGTKTRAKKRTNTGAIKTKTRDKSRAFKSTPKPSTRTMSAPGTKTRAKKRRKTGSPKTQKCTRQTKNNISACSPPKRQCTNPKY